MDTTGERGERPDEEAAAMSAGQQAAFGDGIVGGADGRRGAADRGNANETDATRDRDADDDGLVAGGPIDVGEDAGGSRAGAGEAAADRARAEDARAAQEDAGLAPGESD